MKTRHFLLLAGLVLAVALTFSCSSDDGGGGDPQSYSYCIYIEAQTCFAGPYKDCPSGGIPSNSCPYGDVELSSSSGKQGISSGETASSSSVGSGQGDGSVTYQSQTYRTVRIGDQVWFAENLNYNANGSKCYGEDGQVVVGREGNIHITTTLSPDEVQANCTKYGRLYDWSMAMALPSNCNSNSCIDQINSPHRGICPDGWHIPSNADWDKLMEFVGGESTAGTKLKAKSGWDGNGNGTDDYDFSALPGGCLCYWDIECPDEDPSGSCKNWGSGFCRIGNWGLWWSATEGDKDKEYGDYRRASSRFMFSDDDDYFSNSSVRSENDYKEPLTSVRCLQD